MALVLRFWPKHDFPEERNSEPRRAITGREARRRDAHAPARRARSRERSPRGLAAAGCPMLSPRECRLGSRSFAFSCSPLGGNSAWRPRSRIPSREEPSEIEKEYERHEHSGRPSDAGPRRVAATTASDLRHDPARRRAVAGDLAEQAGKARDRPSAGAPRRGRDRGGLPDHLAGRLRGRSRRSPARSKARLSAAWRGRKRDIDAAWNAVQDSERPRIHMFIATSTSTSSASCRPRARTSRARCGRRSPRRANTPMTWSSLRWTAALGRAVHGRGDPDRARRGRQHDQRPGHGRLHDAAASSGRCSSELYRLVPGLHE